MKDKQLIKCVRRYQRLFGLDHWKIKVEITDSKKNYGKCETNPEYERATIYLSRKKNTSKAKLKLTVIHELMHAFISQLTHDAQTLLGGKVKKVLVARREEALITQIERWPLWKLLK